jgi:hypothetical protein
MDHRRHLHANGKCKALAWAVLVMHAGEALAEVHIQDHNPGIAGQAECAEADLFPSKELSRLPLLLLAQARKLVFTTVDRAVSYYEANRGLYELTGRVYASGNMGVPQALTLVQNDTGGHTGVAVQGWQPGTGPCCAQPADCRCRTLPRCQHCMRV